MSTHTSESQTSAPCFLKIENLSKRFGNFTALSDVSLEIFDRELVCFLGPSGCGKTTLLRAIAGLDIQTTGRIEQAGRDISALPPSQRDFGIVFQSYALFPNLTVYRNIAYGLENTGRNAREIAARVNELLTLVDLHDQAQKYPAQLSGGQQQRIALVRALATSPGLLLLDEPLSALDAKVRVHLRHEVKQLQQKLGVTTIMVTHDQEEALTMADRIVVMNAGVIEQVGTPTDIYQSPKTLFVADFVGSMNILEAVVIDSQTVRLGGFHVPCVAHDFSPGQTVSMAIRPENIITGAANRSRNGAAETAPTIEMTIEEMEFLGSFWRTRLASPQLAPQALIADISVNEAERLTLSDGVIIAIEMPPDRVRVFASQAL